MPVILDRCYEARSLLHTMMKIWIEEYQPVIPGLGQPQFKPYHIGLAAALLRCRSVPEFIHDDEKKKKPGKRKILNEKDRVHDTTSARFHIRTLPEEWPIAQLVFPDGGVKYMPPCSMRIFSKSFKNFLKISMSYLPDTNELLYPNNEDNSAFELACEKLVRMADKQMETSTVSAQEAYEVASKSAYGGYMVVPDGINLPKNDAPTNLGFTYFIPDFISKECKIGFSRDPFNRAAMIKVGRGSIPTCMAILRGGRHTEKLAHMKNNAYHIGGEIYKLEPIFKWLIKVGEGHLRELLQWK